MVVEAPSKDVWTAIRDVGAPHQRLPPGFLVDARFENGARIVTFVNGLVAYELIVDIDDNARRFVWAVIGSGRLTHYNASMQVLDDGHGRSRFVWIADLLPQRGRRRHRHSQRPGHGRHQENAGAAMRFPQEGRCDGTEGAR